MSKSYSVFYNFQFRSRGLKTIRGLGTAARKTTGDMLGLGRGSTKAERGVAAAGKAAGAAGAAAGRMATNANSAGKASTFLGRSAKKAAAGITTIQHASSAALARVRALQAGLREGFVTSGGRGAEAAARARGLGASGILAGRAADASAETSRHVLPGKQGRQGRRGFMSGAVRAGGTAGLTGRLTGGAGGPGTVGVLASGFAAKSLLTKYASFEEAEIMVNAIGKRLGQSKANLGKLPKQARDLGSKTMFEPQDILEGQLLFLKAGRTANDAIAAMPSTLALAAVSGTNVAKATNVALNLMAQGNVPASQLGKTVDGLTATFLNSKAEMLELAHAAGYAMPRLTRLGVPIEQQFAALGALSEAGQAGSRGSRGLSMALGNIQKAPFEPKKVKLMKEYGLNLDKYFKDGKLMDFRGLVAGIDAADKASKGKFIPNFFSQNAARAISAMITKLETFDRVVGAIPNFDGSAEELSVSKFQGLTGAIRQLGAAWSDLGIAFGKSGPGQAVEAAVRRITSGINEIKTSLDLGSFFEEIFDPVLIMGRLSNLSVRLGAAITKVIVEAIAGALNSVGRIVGGGAIGDHLKDWLGYDAMLERIDQATSKIDEAMDARTATIRNDVKARNSRKAMKKLLMAPDAIQLPGRHPDLVVAKTPAVATSSRLPEIPLPSHPPSVAQKISRTPRNPPLLVQSASVPITKTPTASVPITKTPTAPRVAPPLVKTPAAPSSVSMLVKPFTAISGALSSIASTLSIGAQPEGATKAPATIAGSTEIATKQTAQAIRVESSVRTSIDPLQVNVSPIPVRYTGPIGGPFAVGGTAAPSRGTSTVSAGEATAP